MDITRAHQISIKMRFRVYWSGLSLYTFNELERVGVHEGFGPSRKKMADA